MYYKAIGQNVTIMLGINGPSPFELNMPIVLWLDG